jgi:DNA polymerase-3 subunit epsilon/CBS domain-containing protein
VGAAQDLAMLADLHGLLLDLLLDQQLADIAAGIPPGTAVEIRRLDKAMQARLRDGLGQLKIVPILAHDLLFA